MHRCSEMPDMAKGDEAAGENVSEGRTYRDDCKLYWCVRTSALNMTIEEGPIITTAISTVITTIVLTTATIITAERKLRSLRQTTIHSTV